MAEMLVEQDKKFDSFVDGLLSLADSADEAGMHVEADRIAAVLPAVRSLKVAQYEGASNYWIANGRAFEMAWKEKRGDPADRRSATECWWEVLEEYQKGLLGNQKDFVSKYASFHGRQATLPDKAAAKLLVSKISGKLSTGGTPGVAIYESIEEMAEGDHVRMVEAAVKSALVAVGTSAKEKNLPEVTAKADALLKEAGFWDQLKRPFQWLGRGMGLTEIQGVASQIQENADALRYIEWAFDNVDTNGPPIISDLKLRIQPLLNSILRFKQLALKAGINDPAFDIPANAVDAALRGGRETAVAFTAKLREIVKAAGNKESIDRIAKSLHEQARGQDIAQQKPQQQPAAPANAANQASTAWSLPPNSEEILTSGTPQAAPPVVQPQAQQAPVQQTATPAEQAQIAQAYKDMEGINNAIYKRLQFLKGSPEGSIAADNLVRNKDFQTYAKIRMAPPVAGPGQPAKTPTAPAVQPAAQPVAPVQPAKT